MIELLAGLVCFVLGLVLTGTAWAWVELRRDHRRQGAELARLQRQHAEERAAWAELHTQWKKLSEQVWNQDKDLEALCERVGIERYTRGGGTG